MKTTSLISRTKASFLALSAAMIIFSYNSCSAQADFLKSSMVPAARGSVQVTKDRYNNFVLEIHITGLSEAGRLTPSKNTYVVWIVTDKNLSINIGQIRTSTSLLSKSLNAEYETKTAFKPVRVFITAEYEPTLLSPGPDVVMTTENFDLPRQ